MRTCYNLIHTLQRNTIKRRIQDIYSTWATWDFKERNFQALEKVFPFEESFIDCCNKHEHLVSMVRIYCATVRIFAGFTRDMR